MNGARGDFGSDSHAGVHPAVMQAIASANVGQVHSYGDDPYTEAALARFREIFGEKTEVLLRFQRHGGKCARRRCHQSILRGGDLCALGAPE